MNYYDDMLEKTAHMMDNLDYLEKIAEGVQDPEEYKLRKNIARQDYKQRKQDIAKDYAVGRRGAGAAAAGGHLIARGLEAARGGRKAGIGAVTRALGTGGVTHAGASLVTAPAKRISNRNAYDETVGLAALGQY